MTNDLRVQQSVVANLSRSPAAAESGPFVIGLDPGTDSPFINYATPRAGATITAADVAALVDAFRAAGRKPRLEYVTGCAPDLEALLVAAGFTVEVRHTYLVCRPDTLHTPELPDSFVLREPATDAERAAMIGAQNDAFGSAHAATDADVERIGRLQSNGGVAMTARTPDGVCAGGGVAVPPTDGTSELAGIAVREPYRRRGLAGAITAGVTRRLFDAGSDLAWLEADGDDSGRVYERVGYRPAGRRLYISLGS